MHFKNAIFYRLSKPFTPEFNQLGALMADHAFTPCSGQQLSSYGWISPHPAHSFMVFESNGALLITAQRESKLLPASSINRLLTERVAKIKSTEDRTVGRKEKMQLKDEIVIDLLPRALSKFDTTQALIIPNENLIIVDASGFTAAEELLSLLRQTVGSLSIVSPEVINSTSTVMGSWLIADQSESFALGADCSMQDNEQGKAVFKGVDLLSEHVIGHVNDGYQVITIGVCWDSNYFMSLNNDLRISKIKATDELSEAISNDNDDPLVRLDTDTARLSLEFQRLWQDLTTAFGGESKAATQTA